MGCIDCIIMACCIIIACWFWICCCWDMPGAGAGPPVGEGAAVELAGAFVLLVAAGAGAGCCDCCCCWDGKKAWGIIMKGWFPVGIIGVAPGAAPGAPPAGGIIMGTIIIICFAIAREREGDV